MKQKLALFCFTGLGVGLVKLMVSVENTRKGFIAMNEALKKEAEAKVTRSSSKMIIKCGFDIFGIIRCSIYTTHERQPGRQHDHINSNLVCSICERSNFTSRAALDAHLRNPGRQHDTKQPRPCKCPKENLSVTQVYRNPKGFMYKVVLHCSNCSKHPITVPLPADRGVDYSSLEIGMRNIYL